MDILAKFRNLILTKFILFFISKISYRY